MSKKKKRKQSKLLYVVVIAMIAFGGALAYYAYDYFLYWQDGRAAQENTDAVRHIFQGQMDDINQLIAFTPQTNAATDAIEGDIDPMFSISFDVSPLDAARELADNPDIVAYLFIEGTNVSNVVVQGPDNAFYLHRDMFGNRNVNGSLFMDYRNAPNFTDPNTIVYGHNMNNGTMFHNLRYYMQRDFFEAHPHIKVITDDTIFVYEIFSAFSTHIDFDYIQVDFEDDEFGELVEEIVRRSVYDTSVEVSAEDRILVLSTCTNVNRNTRMVVVGRLAIELSIDD